MLAAALGAITSASADDANPLEFTVRPSRTDQDAALDARLARRERTFRFICIGCVRGPGGEGAPFEPVRTLNAPGLAQALAPSAAEVPPPPPAD